MKKNLYSVFIFSLIFVSVFTFKTSRGPHVEAQFLPGPFGGYVTASIYCPNTSSFLRYIYGAKGGINMWMPGATYNYANYTGYSPTACVLGQSSGVMACCATYVCYGVGYISLYEGSSLPSCDLTGATAASIGAASAAASAAAAAATIAAIVIAADAINSDTDGDGQCDLNCDTDGDGIPDVNVDTDGDGVADSNQDTDGDGDCDTACKIFEQLTEDTFRPIQPIDPNLPDIPTPPSPF